MPQVQRRLFPAGTVDRDRDLACRTEEDQVINRSGHMPVVTPAQGDLAGFRPFTERYRRLSGPRLQLTQVFGRWPRIDRHPRGQRVQAEE